MKIVGTETLISKGNYAKSADWKKVREAIHEAIEAVDWPEGSGSFTLFPGRHANGVKPIKIGLRQELAEQG